MLLIACAIATQEGFFVAGSFPQLHNNPGDLEFAGQIGASKVQGSPLAHFESLPLGVNALYRQIRAMIALNMTLWELIDKWSATDKEAYQANVAAWTGLPVYVPLLQLLPLLVKLD